MESCRSVACIVLAQDKRRRQKNDRLRHDVSSYFFAPFKKAGIGAADMPRGAVGPFCPALVLLRKLR
jgi:hypothetical protein